MSVVLIGGNDCMVTRYKDICKSYNCKAKVFTKMQTDFESKLGTPDLMVVFTGTCSHKMLNSVKKIREKGYPRSQNTYRRCNGIKRCTRTVLQINLLIF